MRRTLVEKEETAVASIAQLVGRRKTAVPNVPRAVRVRLAVGATIAYQVNIVRAAIKMLLRALVAPLVLVKVIQDKFRAFHAIPVNSMMLQGLLVANYVAIRRSLVAREETAVASIVQLDGRPKTAVRNVSRAVQVRLALDVNIVHRVLPEKETMTLPNATNVN